MAKEIYIGGSAPKYITTTENVNITAGNISAYFTVSNGSYYFAGSGSTFTTNNGGVASSTAKTTLTAKQDMSNITFNYSYSSEAGWDKFTLTVAGTVVENAVSGATTTKSYNGTLSAGDTIIFQYAKDGSANANSDKCTFSNMVVQIQTLEQDGTVDNVARKVTQPYIGVSNVARKVKSGYIGMGGVARECYVSGTSVGDLTVGASVFMNVNGVSTEFLVVHQGLPDATIYDASCDGTWLLMKNLYVNQWRWNGYDGSKGYNESLIHNYFENEFLPTLSNGVLSIIKQVKIPYCSINDILYTGGNGLSTRAFLLSSCEVGAMRSKDGVVLDYFKTNDRVARNADGYVSSWWIRTQYDTDKAWYITSNGTDNGKLKTNLDYIRPAFILPNETLIDENFTVIA